MDADPQEPPSAGFRGLSEPLLRYLEARGVLLTIEAHEALQQVMRILIFGVLAAAAVFMAWVLLTAALVHLIMDKAGWHWVKAVSVLGVAHLGLAAVFLFVARNRLGALRLFAETLNEFKKDRAWLASPNRKP
jgi:uncharacterized membrane protein YqjE